MIPDLNLISYQLCDKPVGPFTASVDADTIHLYRNISLLRSWRKVNRWWWLRARLRRGNPLPP